MTHPRFDIPVRFRRVIVRGRLASALLFIWFLYAGYALLMIAGYVTIYWAVLHFSIVWVAVEVALIPFLLWGQGFPEWCRLRARRFPNEL